MISTIKRVGRWVEAKHKRLKIIKVTTPNNGGKNRLNIAPNSYLFKSIDVANIHEVIVLKKMSARCSGVGRLCIWIVQLTFLQYRVICGFFCVQGLTNSGSISIFV
jgi:hypothetical protein